MTENEKPDEKPAVAPNENQAQKPEIGADMAESGDVTAPVVEQREEILHNPPDAKPESEEPPPPPPETKPKRKAPPKKAKPQKRHMKHQPERDPLTGRLKPLDINHNQAFKEFKLLGEKGTLEELHEKLIGRMGKEKAPSLGTIKQWSATHKWYRRRLSALTTADPRYIDAQLLELSAITPHASPETVDGLIAQAMSSISSGMHTVEVKSPADVYQMVENLKALIEVKTVFRHALINIPDPDSINPDSEDEVEKVDDRPTIGQFKENISKGGEVK